MCAMCRPRLRPKVDGPAKYNSPVFFHISRIGRIVITHKELQGQPRVWRVCKDGHAGKQVGRRDNRIIRDA